MISRREHGHLRVWVPEAKLELKPRHWGPVVGASHLQDWQKICQESSLRSSDSSWKKPLCPSTQTLHWRVSLLGFSEDRRASEVPLLECRSLQRARSLTRWSSGVMSEGWKPPQFPSLCSGKSWYGSSNMPPGWEVTLASDSGHNVCTHWQNGTL